MSKRSSTSLLFIDELTVRLINEPPMLIDEVMPIDEPIILIDEPMLLNEREPRR